MRVFRDIDTGEIWTEDEVRQNFEYFRDEIVPPCDNFEDHLDLLLDLGRQRIGGLVEV